MRAQHATALGQSYSRQESCVCLDLSSSIRTAKAETSNSEIGKLEIENRNDKLTKGKIKWKTPIQTLNFDSI